MPNKTDVMSIAGSVPVVVLSLSRRNPLKNISSPMGCMVMMIISDGRENMFLRSWMFPDCSRLYPRVVSVIPMINNMINISIMVSIPHSIAISAASRLSLR